MRLVLVFVVSGFLAACTKPNPNVCCVTQAQCDELGAAELRSCEVGQACQASTCVASECATSSDCTNPDSPICVLNLCVGSCVNDDECEGVAGRPYCTPDSTCVECTDAAQCPASAAICDTTMRACRGCERDDECDSEVCLDADGVCAAPETIVWVAQTGADTGICSKASPCETLAFAMQRVSPSRSVVRILGTNISDNAAITIDRSVTIDATNLRLASFGNVPIFNVTSGYVTFEGIAIEGVVPTEVAIQGGTATTVRLVESSVQRMIINTNGGAIEARAVAVREGQITCTGGTVVIKDSSWSRSGVRGSNCNATILDSYFDDAGEFWVSGGVVRVLNNVFVVTSEYLDLLNVSTLGTGSTFAFNTVVNTATVTMSPVALYCDAPTLNVTSNIIAYNSRDPIRGCAVTNSLFDPPAGTDAVGNTTADVTTFFADLVGADYRLASGSPAIGIGEATIVAADIAGLTRPSPAGSQPDAGAHEAP